MTLIAVYEHHGTPVLLADVILSTEFPNQTVKSVPSVDNMHRSFHISGLVQKVYKFGPNLVIAWAGGVLNAKAVVDALEARFGEKPVSATMVQEFLGELPEADSLQIVGICVNRRHKTELIQWKCHGQISNGTRIFAGGTGYQTALNVFRVMASAPHAPTTNDSDMAITSAISAAATLMHSEMDGFPSLQQRFGGAYQIAFSFKGKIELLADWALLSWRTGHLGHDCRHFTLNPIIFRFAYSEDCLLVRRIHMYRAHLRGEITTEKEWVVDNYLYEIGSLRTYPNLPKRLNQTFPDRLLSSFQVHVFEQLPSRDRLVWVMPIGENLENAPRLVELLFKEEPDTGSQLRIPSEFWNDIRQKVFQGVPNLLPLGIGDTLPEDIPIWETQPGSGD